MPLQAPIQCQDRVLCPIQEPKNRKKYENKMLIKYDTKKEENINGSSMDYDKKQEKCADRLFTGKEAKKLEKMAKGKTGIVELIYYCSH
jgi:hypothetical protein